MKEDVSTIFKKVRKAQSSLMRLHQKEIDELCAAIIWEAVQDEFVKKITKLCFKETQLGNIPDKIYKFHNKLRGVLFEMQSEKSIDLIQHDKKKGIKIFAKPVGVIVSLLPLTIPDISPFVNAISAIKGRNAIILSPHPKAVKTNSLAVGKIKEVLLKHNIPENLVYTFNNISKEFTNKLMKTADLVLATGGKKIIKIAHKSGTPVYGAGQGNSVSIIDETADINDAVSKIIKSKTFDFATSCSSENSCIVQENIYNKFMDLMIENGAYFLNAQEKEKLKKCLWINGKLNPNIIAKSANKISKFAGINIPNKTKILIVEESGIGEHFPFSGEKLSIVLTIYKYKYFESAIDLVNKITNYQGAGHSCGIHSFNEDNINKLSQNVNVSRITIRQPNSLSNNGSWTNNFTMSVILGCGTWGGGISNDNINWKHMINYTKVSYPTKSKKVSDLELFGFKNK